MNTQWRGATAGYVFDDPKLGAKRRAQIRINVRWKSGRETLVHARHGGFAQPYPERRAVEQCFGVGGALIRRRGWTGRRRLQLLNIVKKG
ncbi:MAG TPA: hypothetical protein VGK40_05470 [Verrucomicrobiae bacterium]